MKKVFAVLAGAAVVAGLDVLARRFGPRMPNIDCEKRIESMPGNAPPKRMFRDITAIRDNTDRSDQTAPDHHGARPAGRRAAPVRD
jgi:hypothetical protein